MNDIVDIIILNYKNYRDTIKCVDSVLCSTYTKYRIIIIDNDSQNESADEINLYLNTNKCLSGLFTNLKADQIETYGSVEFQKCFFIESSSNLGYGAGNNLGIKLSLKWNDSGYIWILNNDTVVDKNSLKEQLARMKVKEDALICGSKILYSDKTVQCLGGAMFNHFLMTSKYVNDEFLSEDKVEEMLDYVVGASMLIKKDFFERYGLFDEQFFLYFEEMDLVKRIKNQKHVICYASKSLITHKVGGSIGTSSKLHEKSLVSEYHSFRSRIMFTKKYYMYKMPIIYLLGMAYIFHRILYGKFKHALVIFKALKET